MLHERGIQSRISPTLGYPQEPSRAKSPRTATVACSVPAQSTKQPSLGCDLLWHFTSPGRAAKRLVLKGSGDEGPGSHVPLQLSRWQ